MPREQARLMIAKKALNLMLGMPDRDTARRESARGSWAQRGLRKQAIDIAKGILNAETRNETMADLAK